ncbi:metal ABC transporter substrate-binding protein [Ruania zhangjianzhongii]|uniref:metal ABC transporter substrate-binding protein n=1 Tax=Ruania zhangjianzhongii TaxID=2603206 RepID=UPI0011CA9768|nr:metal ABC transporter substrate-binding protein [Ruania zhangjianzhongii]
MTDRLRPAAALVAVAGLLGAAACTPGDTGDGGTSVLASFYPLVFVAEEVGGPEVEVESLTPAGGDPHSLELSPAQIMQLDQADLVVYSAGLQAAVDEAIATQAPEDVIDAMAAAGLTGDTAESRDPHFWLDPTLLEPVATEVAEQLGAADPDHAQEYAARAEELVAELAELDQHYSDELAACQGAVLITSHEAFGYLADRYGLQQEGIAGIDPEVETSPARVREVGELVRDHEVRTLYFETIASPRVTEQLAAELDVDTAVLDPLESPPAEGDYLTAMTANLEALTSGLTCGD